MDAMRLDYPPVIDVRRAVSKDFEQASSLDGSGGQLSASTSAAIEAAKYLSKATHLIEMGPTLPEFHWQTRGLRLYACSKSLRSFIREGDITPEEMNDSVFTPSELKTDVLRATATWFEDSKEYLFTSFSEGAPMTGSKHSKSAKTGSTGAPVT